MNEPPNRFNIFLVDADVISEVGLSRQRPCVVVSPNTLNDTGQTVTVAPFTTRTQNPKPYHVFFRFMDMDNLILLDRLVTINKTRLIKKAGQLDDATQRVVMRALNMQLNSGSISVRMELNKSVDMEEDTRYEFKEIVGKNPIGSIKNTADEYAVAFLNSEGGRIFWGIRDDDRTVVGVKATVKERDELRREITSKLSAIRPHVDLSNFPIVFHEIYEGNEIVPDLFIIELAAPQGDPFTLYFTGGDEAFVKTEGSKHKLKGPAIQEWIMTRYGLKK